MNLTTVNEIGASVLSLQEHIENIILMVTDRMGDEVRPDGNMDWLQECAKEVERLRSDVRALATIEAHAVGVLTDILSFPEDTAKLSPAGLRILTIEVSQGMINQNLLTLTEAKARGVVHEGEKFTIRLPDDTSFSTELCSPGNKLRERGLIRKFYADAKIREGDKVVMTEVSQGSWTLSSLSSDEEEHKLHDELAALAKELESESVNPLTPPRDS